MQAPILLATFALNDACTYRQVSFALSLTIMFWAGTLLSEQPMYMYLGF